MEKSNRVPVYRNSDIETHVRDSKQFFRQYINFMDFDPSFDFQISYVKLGSAQNAMLEHIHENTAEIVYVLRGKQFYRVDRKDYQVIGGEMLLSPPGLVHSGGNVPEQKGEFYYININPSCISHILPSAEPETEAALENMLKHSPGIYSFHDIDTLRGIMDELLTLHSSPCRHKKVRIQCAASRLLLFTLDAIESETLNAAYSDFMRDVYLYIEDHVCEKLTVDSLAEHFQYSKTAFRNKFRGYANLPVHEYILHRKIEKAKQLFTDPDVNANQIWEMLSFSSQSYFNQVFKRFTGMTVSQYILNV